MKRFLVTLNTPAALTGADGALTFAMVLIVEVDDEEEARAPCSIPCSVTAIADQNGAPLKRQRMRLSPRAIIALAELEE